MPEMVQQDLFSPARRAAETLVFDLETQKSFEEVGGRDKISDLRMSVGCTLEVETGRWEVYTEPEAERLIDDLLAAKTVVGFNIRRFDLRVLAPYTKKNLDQVRVLDLLEHLEKLLGHRVKLDTVAQATLGTPKSGHGLLAIEWFRTGQMDRLVEYCKDDVKITSELYLFGRRNGHILLPAGTEKRKVPVQW